MADLLPRLQLTLYPPIASGPPPHTVAHTQPTTSYSRCQDHLQETNGASSTGLRSPSTGLRSPSTGLRSPSTRLRFLQQQQQKRRNDKRKHHHRTEKRRCGDPTDILYRRPLTFTLRCSETRMSSTVGRACWAHLPSEALLKVFSELPVMELGRVARVCRSWHRVTQYPQLWQRFEFVLSSISKSYLVPTPPGLVNFVLRRHAQHLKFVVFRIDSTVESAQRACHILSRLVNCSLKTLALISSVRPVFMDVDQQSFVSALTLVLDHSTALSSLAIDNTPVDDPSLRALASSSNSRTLQLLRMKSCPRVSPGGIVALADHCRCLRELSLSYTLLSDELLLALSSERHVRLEYLRIDVHTDKKDGRLCAISPRCWQALVKHSPGMNLIMYVFAISEENLETLFSGFNPATHLYFGDCLPRGLLARVGKYCPRLRELVVGAHAHGGAFADAELLSIAANCPNLSALGLGECEVSCASLVQLVSVYGPRLAHLSVMEESLVEDSNFDLFKTCRRVSELLGRDWTPEFSPIW